MPDETTNNVKTYLIKTPQGNFKIKAPAGTPHEQVLSQAVSASPKFARVYPSIQSHQKMQDFAKKTIQPVSEEGLIAKDPIYKGLTKAATAPGPEATTPSAIAKDPHWYGRSARYLGGELVGMDNAVIGGAAGGYKLLHDVVSAIDPTDKEDFASRAARVGSDIKGAGSAIGEAGSDIASGIKNLLTLHPEAAADPVKFGQKLANAAMVVDGGIKMTAELGKSAGLAPDQIGEAIRAARTVSDSKYRPFQLMSDLRKSYRHAKGIDIQGQFKKAADSVHAEVVKHAKALSDQIDKNVPTGVIDATAEAAKIKQAFDQEVKTNDNMHPALKQAYQDALATPPGQWTFEKVKQLRSNLGRAQKSVTGPQAKVIYDVRNSLTKQLASVAKKAKMENSWNHYNRLETKYMNEFGDLTDKIINAPTGGDVANILSKDTAVTGELTKNLAKYGLDRVQVHRYMADAAKIAKAETKMGSIFRIAYGTPLGAAGMIAGRAAGLGYLPSAGIGFAFGLASSSLVNIARTLKLNPDIIKTIMDARELPDKMPVSVGDFSSFRTGTPSGNTPPPTPQLPQAPAQLPQAQPQPTAPQQKQLPAPAPQPQQSAAPAPSAQPPKESPTPPAAAPASTPTTPRPQKVSATAMQRQNPGIGYGEATKLASGQRALTERLKRATPGLTHGEASAKAETIIAERTNQARAVWQQKAKEVYRELAAQGKEPTSSDVIAGLRKKFPDGDFEKYLKPVAEGEHSEGRRGELAKQAENKAELEEAARRNKQKETEEAQQRAIASNVDVNAMGIPELEDILKERDKIGLSAVMKWRRAHPNQTEEYVEALKFLTTQAMEKSLRGKKGSQ